MKHTLLILLLFLSFPAVAADKWTRVQSKNFTLVGNASEKEIREVAENLEVFRTAYSRFFKVKEGSSVATTVVVFKSDQAFKPFKPIYQGKPANISGFFQAAPDMNFIALAADMQTPRVIYHEYVHRLMSDNMGGLPPWFQEGFAESFSTLEIEGRDKKVRIGRAIAEHVQLLNERRFMPLEKLFAVVHGSPEYNEAEKQGLFYAESWAFVHYMMFDTEQRRRQFLTFLEEIRIGKPAQQAFEEVFKTDVASFQKTFEAYILQRMAWNAFELQTPGGLDRSKDMTARVMSEAEAEFYLGDLLLHSSRLTEAESHLRKAIQIDPKLGTAQAALGRLLMRNNKDSEALGYLQRGAELDPSNYLAHYYYASVLRSQKTEARLATARSELQKAIELAPQFVEATTMLADINLSQNIDIPHTVGLLSKAIVISPGEDYLVLQLAFALSLTQQREDARPLVRSLLAKATLELPLRQNAQTLMEFLDRAAAAAQANRAIAERIARGPQPLETPANDADVDFVRNEIRRTARADEPVLEELPPIQRPTGGLAAGTARISGLLTLLDCRDGLTLSLIVDGKTVKLHSRAPNGIKFTSFNSGVSGQISCGPAPGNGVPAVVIYGPQTLPDSLGEPLSVDFVAPAVGPNSQTAGLPAIPNTSTVKGLLTMIDCTKGVLISLTSEGRTLQFRNDALSKVAFLNGPNPDGSANCGPIGGAGLPVTVLYRPGNTGTILGELLIVQFQN